MTTRHGSRNSHADSQSRPSVFLSCSCTLGWRTAVGTPRELAELMARAAYALRGMWVHPACLCQLLTGLGQGGPKVLSSVADSPSCGPSPRMPRGGFVDSGSCV